MGLMLIPKACDVSYPFPTIRSKKKPPEFSHAKQQKAFFTFSKTTTNAPPTNVSPLVNYHF